MKIFLMWLPLAIAVICNSAANIFMKKASINNENAFLSLYLSPYFIIGAIFFGINMVFYAKALQKISLSVAYPILVGLSLLLISIFSLLFSNEKIEIHQITGMVMVIAGIYFILSGA